MDPATDPTDPNPVSVLLHHLHLIDASKDIVAISEPGFRHELVEKALYWAEIALITDSGCIDTDAVQRVTSHGYTVYAGEKDVHGWLTGCIETKKGVLVFG